MIHQCRKRKRFDVFSPQQDFPVRYIPKPSRYICDGAFPAARGPHKGNRLPLRYIKRKVMQHFIAAVPERNVFKRKFRVSGRRNRFGSRIVKRPFVKQFLNTIQRRLHNRQYPNLLIELFKRRKNIEHKKHYRNKHGTRYGSALE